MEKSKGKKSAEIDKVERYVQICEAVDAGDNDAHFPCGESRNMVVKRFKNFLQSIKDKDNILISTHGGILRSFFCLCGGVDRKIPNCGGISFSLNAQCMPNNIVFFD